MPDAPDWRQLLETGRQFTAMTRAEAQQLAQQLVREGKLAQDKMQAAVDGLVRASRERADELVAVVRAEVSRQLEARGLKEPSPAPAKKKTKKTKKTKKQAAKKKAGKKKAGKKKAGEKKAGKKQAGKTQAGKKQAGKKAGKKQTANVSKQPAAKKQGAEKSAAIKQSPPPGSS